MPRLEPQISRVMLEGLEGLVSGLTKPPVTLSELLAEAGVREPVRSSADPLRHETMPLSAYAALLERAAVRTGNPCFGLAFARAFPVFGTGTIGYISLNSPDLRTMIQSVIRYAGLMIGSLAIAMKERGASARVTWQLRPEPPWPHKQLMEFLSALFVLRIGQYLGRPLELSEAHFVYPEPPCRDDYRAIFGRALRFSAKENCLVFPARFLALGGVAPDLRLHSLLRSIAEQELALVDPAGGPADDLSSYILEHLATDGATLAGAAAHFNLTPRQLQVRLSRAGTTFEAELTRLRKQLAERYLRDTDLPLTEIAMMLGFSQLSAFTRAARGWFNMPPSEARQALRQSVRPA